MAKILDRINNPADLQKLSSLELADLAGEIRSFLVENVAKTGGHMGPNLGVVELTIALHRMFSSPTDTIIFDTGHQAYVHKILTGRKNFAQLRTAQGLSGYPSRAESVHDVVENSHASTALSWAQGVAEAKALKGDRSYTVAVIGDGAMTGGMTWEALNNISERPDLRLIIVVNDNGRSYEPTIGGLAHHLDALRTSPAYEKALRWGKQHLKSRGKPGELTYDALHGIKRGMADMVSSEQVMFSDLGIKYTGPVDGHDIVATEFQLARAKEFSGPIIVHVITEKGRGYSPAEENDADHFHTVGPIHPETGLPVKKERFGWTSVFAEEIVQLAKRNPKIVGISAAMMEPVGLKPLRSQFPQRVFDVGIAEQHAMTMAAGLSFAGCHPVIALYATFLNRAFDQLLMDASLHKQGITVILDRAGITGADGASHNGMWDLAIAAMIPGIRVAAPRDASTLRKLLGQAVSIEDGPTIVRYPKGSVPPDIKAEATENGLDILFRVSGTGKKILVVAVGSMADAAISLSKELAARGHTVKCVDPGWVIPASPALLAQVEAADLVVTVEDGEVTNGVGALLRTTCAGNNCFTPIKSFGIPRAFLPTDSRDNLLESSHMTPSTMLKELADLLD